MKTIKSLGLLIAILVIANSVYAQDLIYKKNKEVILSKIVEIGLDEIKYREYNNSESIVYSIAKSEITKIKFENGKEEFFVDDMQNSNLYADQKKQAIKFDFFSPIYYRFSFGYERSIKPGQSMEFGLGIVGLGNLPEVLKEGFNYDASGAFARAGLKFIKTPDFYLRGMKYAHILKGSYFKPEFVMGSVTQKFDEQNWYTGIIEKRSINNTYIHIMLTAGKQTVFDDVFLIDYFVGMGYNIANTVGKSSNIDIYDYASIGGTMMRFQAGFKVGYLFK